MTAPRSPKSPRMAGAFLALGILCSAGCSPPQPPAPPSVLLIVMDTTRADHLSHAGWKNDTTPNLSVLLDDAVLYSQARSVAPWTLPAHMSMFTGRLPGEHRATWAAMDADEPMELAELLRHPFRPPFPEQMLGKLLAELGHDTVGISCNPWISERTGFGLGFRAFHAAWSKPQFPDPELLPSPLELPVDPKLSSVSSVKALLAFNRHLRANGLANPFFVFFNLVDPHYPYVADRETALGFGGDPEVFAEMQDPRRRKREIDIMAGAATVDFDALVPFYDAGIHRSDWAVGELIAWLKRHDRYDDTLIIVTADHGEHLGEQGRFSHQLSVEEELLRVPLIVKYPQSRDAGTVVDNPFVSVADVYATILAAVTSAETPALYSRDLARGFDRPYAVAESYFSDSYLNHFRDRNPEFALEPHRATRRVIYAAGRKYVFRDMQLEKVEALEESLPGDTALEERMTEWLRNYAATLETDPLAGQPDEFDRSEEEHREFIESLRALGYVR